jgi:S1-C subfamily serine protease
MRHKLLGMSPLEMLSGDDRQKNGLAAEALGLRIKQFPPAFVKECNREAAKVFQKDDILVDVDGRKDLAGEGGLLGYLMQKKPGEGAEFTVLRGGKPQKITLPIP